MMVQIRQFKQLIFIACFLVLTACSSNPTVNQNNGPILLQEVTIASTNAQPTRALTNTPSPTPPVLEAPQQVPLTVESGFVLVTPTLPPSKTPTMTPTITPTPTTTPIIIPTLLPTTPAPNSAFPTSAIVPLTNIPTAYPPDFNPNNPLNPPIVGSTAFPTTPLPCQYFWFFPEPKPPVCPLSPQTLSPAAYQPFENGFMIWVGSQDAIYVMFNDVLNPRWQVVRDNYEEGMPADDPAYNTPPNPMTYQPRRGLGLVWRNNETIRTRLGWATTANEIPYNAQTQTGADSSLFLSDSQNGIFMLLPQGIEWERYAVIGVIIP